MIVKVCERYSIDLDILHASQNIGKTKSKGLSMSFIFWVDYNSRFD